MSDLSAEILHSMLDYDASTGIFKWRIRSARNVRAGSIAGRIDGRGYIAINIRGRKYAAHRLAWLYIYGQWPQKQIDHINHDPADNRITNLRDVSGSDNCRNRRRLGGVMGVSFHKNRGKWQAQICLPVGRTKYLGVFDTEAAAFAAYRKAASEAFL